MNNNNLDQISMRSSKRKRSRFNLKSVNDTSFSMGEIQPVLVKEVVPNSNSVLSVGNIVRLAPMNAPTFGQMKLHHNFSFVGMSDLTDKFSAFLANQPVAFGGGLVQVPTELPQVTRDVLSAMMLVGCKCSVYFSDSNQSYDNLNSYDIRRFYYNLNSSWTSSSPIADIIQPFSSASSNALSCFYGNVVSDDPVSVNEMWCGNIATKDPSGHWQTAWKNYDGPGLNVGRLLGWSHSFWVPSSNFSPYSFLASSNPADISGVTGDAATQLRQSAFFNPVLMDLEDVTPESADYIIHNRLSNSSGNTSASVIVCIRLSDFGKRVRKLLLACGYGVEFNDDITPVSLMRLCAIYKAWFDSFGITLYQSWETTNCAKLLQYYDSDYLFDWNSIMKNADTNPPTASTVAARQTFVAFFADLADMWFTEEQDFISAHIRSAAVSPNDGVPSALADSPNVNSRINITDTNITGQEPASIVGGASHAYIDQVLHSQLDSEILKRLYKVTNRNTIAGRRIAELLKAQGLGEYMKRCRSRFIGHWACEVDVFDVTATADSMNTVDGKSSVLGEFVGKGVGNGKSKRFKYSSSEYGFIIDLAAIVPESGWTNGEDLSVRNIRKLDFYNPEYDGLGYELNPKSIVSSDVISSSLASTGRQTLCAQSFGFVPRYTRLKVARNVLNGDFSRRGVRASFLPYSLDKYVSIGDRYSRLNTPATSTTPVSIYTFFKTLSPNRVPIASPMYRYLARYPWMGNLLRIFTNIGRDKLANDPYVYQDYDAVDGESVNAWYVLKTDDNFAVQNVFLYDYYAPMLPIEDSFETHEDGNNGPSDMAIGKA